MAAIPFCAVPGSEGTHNLVEQIEIGNISSVNRPVYETLRLPSYKSHAAHLANIAAIQAELGAPPSGCACGPRRAAALGSKLRSLRLEA
jgi:hypothetical protein